LTVNEDSVAAFEVDWRSSGRPTEIAPADRKLYSLRDSSGTVESIPLIASSIMSREAGCPDWMRLVLDCEVGSGAFMKKQVEARRLAQIMVGIGRRMGNKRVQALITNMDQPLGYAIGNALEVMEVSQTLQNVGPVDLHEISIELAARMIHLGKKADSIDQAREMAQAKILDGSAYRKFKEVIQAQAAIRRCWTGSSCCRTRPGLARFCVRGRATSARSMPRISAWRRR
jgi:thymidine phosphorylase